MDIHGVTSSLSDGYFLRSRVARLGLGVHRIEAGQCRAVVHLVDDPGFHPLLLRPFGQHMVEQRLRDQHRAVLVGDDDVVREIPQRRRSRSVRPSRRRSARRPTAARRSRRTTPARPVPSTPSTSRTTPSVTSAATPRLTMRAHRMSPKMPASVTPMASTTAMQPSGMASIAVRVEIGDDQDSGVARSSRAGTKRSVKAGPTSRGCPGPQRLRAAHPDVSQALLEQHGGDGGGGHAGKGRDGFGGQGHLE